MAESEISCLRRWYDVYREVNGLRYVFGFTADVEEVDWKSFRDTYLPVVGDPTQIRACTFDLRAWADYFGVACPALPPRRRMLKA